MNITAVTFACSNNCQRNCYSVVHQ